MRVNKTKRRLLKWDRYRARYIYLSPAQFLPGHAKAYYNVMYAKRWVPNGIREPYIPRWSL